MTKRKEHEPGARAVDRYLADQAAGDETDAATFARCDAVMALLPRIGRLPDVAWAFDEARWIARGRIRAMGRPVPWYLKPALGWAVAGMLAIALVITSLPRTPAGPAANQAATSDSAPVTAAPAVANITFAPVVISTELAQMLAAIDPVVLLANAIPVDARSLVVLPFAGTADTGPSLESAVVADSIYTQVLRQLSAVPGLVLIDSATAAIYTDSGLTPEEIALQLGVRGIVEGRVVSINGDVRFELRLTDAAAAGSSIDEAIERPTDELALLQRDIAASVLDALARTRPPIQTNDIL